MCVRCHVGDVKVVGFVSSYVRGHRTRVVPGFSPRPNHPRLVPVLGDTGPGQGKLDPFEKVEPCFEVEVTGSPQTRDHPLPRLRPWGRGRRGRGDSGTGRARSGALSRLPVTRRVPTGPQPPRVRPPPPPEVPPTLWWVRTGGVEMGGGSGSETGLWRSSPVPPPGTVGFD